MQRPTIILGLAMLAAFVALGQTGTGQVSSAKQPYPAAASYAIRIWEVQTDPDSFPDTGELVETIRSGARSGGITIVEAMQFTAALNQTMQTQFGESVPMRGAVPQGENSRPAVRQFMDVGTIVRLHLNAHPDGILLNIEYESSRLLNRDSTETSVARFSAESGLLLTPGEYQLVAGSSAAGRYLVVTLDE